MGDESLLTPKACDGQVPGTTALSIDELQWWKRHVSVHSFIYSLTPNTTAFASWDPSRSFKALWESLKLFFQEGVLFSKSMPLNCSHCSLWKKNRLSKQRRVKLLAPQGSLGPSVGWSLKAEVSCQEHWDFFLCSHQAGPRSEQTLLMQLGLEVTTTKPTAHALHIS